MTPNAFALTLTKSQLLIVLSTSIVLSTAQIRAQCNQQPPNQPAQTGFAVPPGTTVYYAFDEKSQILIPPGTGTTPNAQIAAAFDAWSKANNQAGGINTTFALADSTHAATVTISADQNTGTDSATTSASAGIISSTNPASITFHPQSWIAGTSQNAFQVTQPGYDRAYLATALHEIGHLMGIGDYADGTSPPPGPDRSVVAPTIGVNDNGDPYPKSAPTPCDQQQAATASNQIYQVYEVGGTGPPNSGINEDIGSGGGTGGYGLCSEYWDPSTNTLYCF